MTNHVCKYCGSTVELRPQYDADAPKRWIHIPSFDYRCLLFAEPYAPFGQPVDVPDSIRSPGGQTKQYGPRPRITTTQPRKT